MWTTINNIYVQKNKTLVCWGKSKYFIFIFQALQNITYHEYQVDIFVQNCHEYMLHKI